MIPTFLKANVTCVKFVGHHLLAGVGSELHIQKHVKLNTTNNWKRLCTIKVFPSQNIYGIVLNESNILLCGGRMLAVIECEFEPVKYVIKKICRFNDWILDAIWLENESNIAILAANNILYKFDIFEEITICKLISQELCILYSGKILNTIWEDLIVLSGTVFQQIVIWGRNGDQKTHILHRLKGHKGVIFSINYDTKSNLICSTSDDRTVRIWSVEFLSKEQKRNWNDCLITLKLTIFSHSARVWKSLIIDKNRFISVGEDSLICMWNENGECINKWYGHQGGAIWGVDYSADLELIATCGSDGGVNLWPVCENILPYAVYQCKPKITAHIPRSITLTLKGDIILITNDGKLLYYKDNHWIQCNEDKKYASYCLLQICPNRKILAMGNMDGYVAMSRVDEDTIFRIWERQILKGRVYSLFWLTESLLILCGSEGELSLWRFQTDPVPDMICLNQFILPKCKERWITTALLVDEFILTGDRCGSVHLYDLRTTDKEPIHQIRKLHDYKGVSSIKLVKDRIISTGRDGTYRGLTIKDRTITVCDINKLQLDWIATIKDTSLFGPVVIGFYDIYFIIWSCNESRPLLRLDCGGGHRSWDWLIDEASNLITIIFIKDKTVFIYRRELNLIYYKTAEIGYHSKSINAACLLPSNNIKCSYILTGGEDNSFRIASWRDNYFTPEITLNRHISSIRAICLVSDDKDNSFIAVTCGGRGQLIVWKILESQGKLNIEEAASHMVRGIDFHQKPSKQIEPLPDAETRYMDVNIVRKAENNFLILAGCSDGVFRLLNFNKDVNKVNIVKLGHFHERCILKVGHFIWKHKLIGITMTTEGSVTFWNFEDKILNLTPKATFNLHSLGINSYSVLLLDDRLILATGSDDSSLALTVFNINNLEFSLLTSCIEKTIHTCQITGIQILGNLIVSVGLDQKVSLLRWQLKNECLTMSLIKQTITTVPDVHGLLAWNDPENCLNVCAFGLGIEFFKENIANLISDEIK